MTVRGTTKLRRAIVAIFAVAASCLALSCSSSSSNVTPAAQACMDVADAMGKAALRCNEDYDTEYAAFVNSAANGSCNNITGVRDSASLYNTCISSYTTITCADFNAGKLDATCDSQLLHE